MRNTRNTPHEICGQHHWVVSTEEKKKKKNISQNQNYFLNCSPPTCITKSTFPHRCTTLRHCVYKMFRVFLWPSERYIITAWGNAQQYLSCLHVHFLKPSVLKKVGMSAQIKMKIRTIYKLWRVQIPECLVTDLKCTQNQNWHLI